LSKSLVRGEKIEISKVSESLNSFIVIIKYKTNEKIDFDIDPYLFLVKEDDKTNKEDIVFYNNTSSSCNGFEYNENYDEDLCKKEFLLDLNKCPKSIKKILFACTIYKNDNLINNTFNLEFLFINKILNIEIFNFSETININEIETIIIGEIYKRTDNWKFNMINRSDKEQITNILSIR